MSTPETSESTVLKPAATPASKSRSTRNATVASKAKDRLSDQESGPPTPMGHGETAMYVGIDLGTSRTSIAASNGERHTVRSWVGYPKDIVAKKRLGRDVLLGDEALDNRLALDMVKPMKRGVIDPEDPRCLTAVQELLKNVIGLCGTGAGKSIYAVVGVPARASIENQKAILQAAKPFITSAMVASEPFSVAYGMDLLSESLVVDIGAGTIDLCRMHGTMPEESDQITLYTGGDAVDEQLEREILKLHPNVQLTRNMARQLKEKYGFVTDPNRRCMVTLTEMGQPKEFDITEPLKSACTTIVPDVIKSIHRLIGTFDPEFQSRLRNNVVLAGGGSGLNGLALLVEEGLDALGGGRVYAVEEPMYAGANGALKMAMEMPAKYWKYRTL